MKNKEMTFETAVKRLDEIIAALDAGDAPLDDSLNLFSEGARLIAFCNEKLEAAKLQVETLFPEPSEVTDA